MENSIDAMGLTFLCNSMVESLYFSGELNEVSEDSKKRFERVIYEFRDLKDPTSQEDKRTYKVFDSNYNIDIFEEACKEYGKNPKEAVDMIVDGLVKLCSKEDLKERSKTSEELMKFFDLLGDQAWYASRNAA